MSKAGLFLLDPVENDRFVNGNGPRQVLSEAAVHRRYLAAAAILNLLALGAQASAYWTKWSQLGSLEARAALGAILVTVLANVAGYGIYRAFLRRARRESKLSREGRLLDGQVVSCVGRYDGAYTVELAYGFQTPDGRKLSGKEVRRRDDLQGAALPGPGTPVAVLYLDDANYQAM